jgi:hypothetical protein
MNEKIMDWSSKFVYDDKLVASDLVKDHCLPNEFPVLLLINTAECGIFEEDQEN